jgi:hypothetical protein
MLAMSLRILTVIGIILLVVTALLLAVILLILFFPVTYDVRGSKCGKELKVTAGARWLFGLLRMKYRYPEPGRVIVKALWFTLYDSGSAGEEKEEKDPGKKAGAREKKGKKKNPSPAVEENADDGGTACTEAARETEGAADCGRREADVVRTETDASTGAVSDSDEEKGSGAAGSILKKFKKIKYTIRNIYDKIREVWENISYYTELLREEDTRQLFAHIWLRLDKILRNIRPRHLRADILFGTGSPDTTGYAYGAYCMVSSALGKGFLVTPDFERAVFQAEFEVSGHITLWVLSVNALKLFLDKRLKAFIRKLKKAKTKKA